MLHTSLFGDFDDVVDQTTKSRQHFVVGVLRSSIPSETSGYVSRPDSPRHVTQWRLYWINSAAAQTTSKRQTSSTRTASCREKSVAAVYVER